MIRCVVGLGNPGARYADTRHNAGFRVADALAASAGSRWAIRWWRPYWHALLGPPRHLLCCKPATFMNRSGRAVASVCRRHGFRADELLVVCDDVHLPLGRLRARQDGSAGGHHGLESVIGALGTEEFPRLRLGVGEGDGGRIRHVLGPFVPDEQAAAVEMIEAAAQAVLLLVENWDAAVPRVNGWRSPARMV